MEELDIKAGQSSFSRAGFALLVFVVVTVALQLVGSRVFIRSLNNEWLAYALAVLPQYFVAMPLAALMMNKIPALSVPKRKLKTGQFLIIVMICFAIMYAGNLSGILINLIIQALTHSNMTNLIQQLIAGSSIWANLVFVVALAPVAEELFFRRLLIPKLLPFGEKPAIIISGLAFGLIHGNFSQFFYAFGLGLAFGHLFVKTGRVSYTIILHMLINFFGSIVSALSQNANIIVTGLIGLTVLGLVVAGTVLFFVNKKRIVMSAGLLGMPKGKSAVFLNAGMLLFFAGSAAMFVANTLAMFAAA